MSLDPDATDAATAQTVRDSMMILQLLQDDLVLWATEMQKGKYIACSLVFYIVESTITDTPHSQRRLEVAYTTIVIVLILRSMHFYFIYFCVSYLRLGGSATVVRYADWTSWAKVAATTRGKTSVASANT